jgi:NADH:ubiquinone oxidoreductase subunit
MADMEEQGLMRAVALKKETAPTVVDTSGQPSKDTQEPEGEPSGESQKYTKVDWEKRYSDHRSWASKEINSREDRIKELESQIAESRPRYTPPKTAEELERFREDNPDIYAVAETVAHNRVSNELKTLQEEIKSLKKVREDNLRSAAFAELKKYHPDFEAIKNSQEFQNWAENQPAEIQEWLFKRVDAKLAARAIDLFKSEYQRSQSANTKGTRDAHNADTVKTKGAVETASAGNEKVWTQSEIKKMSIKEYEKYREDIDKAFVEGRVRPN